MKSSGRLMISDVARMLGISRETLRYYEQKGIIRPHKGEKNKYRSYDMQDVCILIRIRIYLQYGFSLEEAKQLIYDRDEQYADEFLRSRMDTIEREIHQLTQMLNSMRRRHLDLLDTMRATGEYRIETRPRMALLYITDENGGILPQPEAQNEYAFWINEMLHSFPCVEYNMNEQNERVWDRTGQGIFLPDDSGGKHPIGNCITVYPPCECLHTGIIMHQGPNLQDYEPLSNVLRYMDEQGLKHHNKILARTMHVCSDEIGFKYFRDIWVPLRS